ncbi:hypothetical protein KKH23_04425, partial [Patescibacteria group bacterium]|nr:hypothetical protein [Patescibacteria group bacterium]
MKLLITISLFFLLTVSTTAFEPPTWGDPWYYQSNEQGLMFLIPDKAQHYYGSYILGEVITTNTNEWIGPLVALGLGFVWEVKDD